jgi:hypothetical protein
MAALQECEERLTLLIDADRHKLLDVLARNKAREAIAAVKRTNNMKQIKTSGLSGAALDYIVALCEGFTFEAIESFISYREEDKRFRYSTDWAQGGPIIEHGGITVSKTSHGFWEAYKRPASENECYQVDHSALIAAMRCYVASKLGDAVIVPDELIE